MPFLLGDSGVFLESGYLAEFPTLFYVEHVCDWELSMFHVEHAPVCGIADS